MTNLPVYSGPGGRCPKCGADGISTEWHASSKRVRGRQEVPCSAPCDDLRDEGEHLCRGCGNCGYGWAEACAASDDATRMRIIPDTEGTDQCPG